MRVIFAVLVVFAALFSGCALYGEPKLAGQNETQTPEPTVSIVQNKELPEFSIKSPAEGSDMLAGDMVVELETQHFSIGKSGSENKENQGYFQLFLDKLPPVSCQSTMACALKNVSQGSHTLKVEAYNNDETIYKGVAARTVKFTSILPSGFDIEYPIDGLAAPYGTLVVRLKPINFAIGSPGSANKLNEGHFYLYLDDGDAIACAALQCPIIGVATGKHTLKVELRNNDRTPYKDAVGRIISFTAIGAAG